MVCESLGKGLVMQREDASPPVHLTSGKLHCYLIGFLGRVSICWSFLRFKVDLSSWESLYLIGLNRNHSKV